MPLRTPLYSRVGFVLAQARWNGTRSYRSFPALRLKEDADRHPEHIEQKKREQIDKQKRGEGHWHEELASAGESNVKADRDSGKVGDHGSHIEDLQKHTEKKAQKGEM
jgi:hypothetical protein